jgi:hypothetical protein
MELERYNNFEGGYDHSNDKNNKCGVNFLVPCEAAGSPYK